MSFSGRGAWNDQKQRYELFKFQMVNYTNFDNLIAGMLL
jgi:hypothetical protein